MQIGTPFTESAVKVLLLGSGELGKEVTIELMRLGIEVIACDRYPFAPAMQVAHRSHVLDMLNPQALRDVVLAEKPHFIVPEIEAIATSELLKLEEEGFRVVPTARAVLLTMDREGIRRVAHEELGLPTAAYRFANTFAEFEDSAHVLGFPCVVKPLMSSSGKGQSVVWDKSDLARCWELSQSGGRTGAGRVIVEEFVYFDSEITLLTVRSVAGTAFCPPIGHRQQEGDYVESWQPHFLNEEQFIKATEIAEKITSYLGGFGLFGVELFLLKDGRVLFSEVSPRPHDTGMVTLITQDQSEFALHARAILGLPVKDVLLRAPGASVALRATEALDAPTLFGIADALSDEDVDLRWFGKPVAHPKRRMGVILAKAESAKVALEKARAAHEKLRMEGTNPHKVLTDSSFAQDLRGGY